MKLIDRLSPPWILTLHAPIGVVIEPEPTGLGDILVAQTGLRREVKVGYQTPGVLDLWATERGSPCVTLELPRITHDEAVVRFAPMLQPCSEASWWTETGDGPALRFTRAATRPRGSARVGGPRVR